VQGSEVAGQERRSWNGLRESGGRCRGAKGRHERPVLFGRETAARQEALSLVVEKKTPLGEQRGKKRTALRNTKLSAVHAGGERSWESGHLLEPGWALRARRIERSWRGATARKQTERSGIGQDNGRRAVIALYRAQKLGEAGSGKPNGSSERPERV